MTSQTTFTSCMHDQMLESNRDDVKLEAMRCVTVMTAKGKLSVPRTLFPHIVKNVSSKNPELKKLIYLYLTNFADQEPDLALLPVATLQKFLKSPNPLVRSSALKVLTSMRLNILSAILMATLRHSVNDLSPYVRKTVAHSIIKIYRLDSSLKPDLVEYIERLFNDKNSMVLSSVVAAYEVVCPERLDLVQKHYKRFCFILADCNEWGQTLMLKLLVRYILKTCKPTKDDTRGLAEQDPKVLLRSAKPLVHSNNSAVVMAVIKLFIAIADHNEVRSTITRPLIRMLYSHREIQLVVLNMIEELTTLTDPNVASAELESDEEEEEGNEIKPQTSASASQNIEVPQRRNEDDSIKTQESNNIPSEASVEPETEPGPVVRDGYIAFDEGDADDVVADAPPTAGASANPVDNGLDDSADKNANKSDKEKPDKSSLNESEEDGEESKSEEEEEEEEEDSDEDSDEDEESESDDEDESDEEESEEEELCNNIGKTTLADDNGTKSDKEDDKKDGTSLNYINLNANKDSSAFREVFRPYIKSFFVKHTDCTQIRLVKLKILTNLSSSVNVTQILRELQTYIEIYVDDIEFVSAAIHAIGRCAVIVKEVAPTCLNGLTPLLSNNNEHIVSEAIVVLRSQIIKEKIKNTKQDGNTAGEDGLTEADGDKGRGTPDSSQVDDDEKMVSTVIKQVTKLMPTVTAPQARATILWILAEFCDKNLTATKCTPNVLRLIAKSFCQEDNFVKLQSLTLVSKYLLSLDKEKKADLYEKIRLLASYLFSLAKYDINHDVRDRGRFLKKLLEDEGLCAKVLNGVANQSPSLGLAA